METVIEIQGNAATATQPASTHPAAGLAATALLSAGLAACGGGGDSAAGAGSGGGGGAAAPTASEASRFLAQSSLGASRSEIASVQALGYSAWLDAHFAMPASAARWDALVAGGFADPSFKNGEAGFDACAWRKLLSSPDTLRQRVTLALSELMVTSIGSLTGGGWKAFAAANYLDLLEANAFGNFRTLMQQVSTNTAMGMYLTFRASKKANPATGSLPDENYARELMQLFTIGLVQLDPDGTPKMTGGTTMPTYTQSDITGLAKVFTGWDFDLQGQSGPVGTATPDFMRRPMVQIAGRHELGLKTFLGVTIPANTDGVQSLQIGLDTIFAHANVAPFVSRQLIQRLVASNPSPAYLARVAAVFNDDGSGVKGNLKAVVKAVLLDDDARSAAVASGPSAGKMREPMLRFAAWARAFGATSASDAWAIGDTSSASTRLGQSPLRSPSVFNFFRPGYVPPNSAIAAASLVAPEFQITNESTVVGAVNYLQRAVSGAGVGDVVANYASLLAIADDAVALVAEINLVLAAGQLSAATAATISTAVATIAAGSDPNRLKRVQASLTLVLAAPEFVVLK